MDAKWFFSQYKSPCFTDTNSKFVKQGDFVYIMKATGIVRRIEECVIIGQKLKKPHKH